MKIVLVHKFYFEHRGAERYLFDLEKILREQGHEVIPFALQHPHNKQTPYSSYFLPWVNVAHPKGFREYIRMIGRVIYSFEAKKYFENLIKDVQPDIVHIQNIYHHISPSILDVCRSYSIPVVQTIHDYKLICPNYKLFCHGAVEDICRGGAYWKEVFFRCVKGSFWKSLLACIEMTIHTIFCLYDRGVDMYIAPSVFVSKKLIEYGVPKNKLIVLPHSIDATKYTPSFEVGTYLIYVGSLSEEKGVKTLIQAMKGISLPLKIVGEGPELSSLISYAKQCGVQEKVECMGVMRGDFLHTAIRGAAAVIVPSLWHEVFGYVVLEGWALGKIVIASDRGALPELIERISKKLLFHAGDSKDLARIINTTLSDKEFSIKVAREGRLLVEKEYTPEKYYESLFQIYSRIVMLR